jgi:hypothetical protein
MVGACVFWASNFRAIVFLIIKSRNMRSMIAIAPIKATTAK